MQNLEGTVCKIFAAYLWSCLCCTWCLPPGPKPKRFNSHAIKQKLHGFWDTLSSKHDLRTQQRNVHAQQQQKAAAYPHAELQSFCRMLRCCAYCNRCWRFTCGYHYDSCKTTGYCVWRRWHRPSHTHLWPSWYWPQSNILSRWAQVEYYR